MSPREGTLLVQTVDSINFNEAEVGLIFATPVQLNAPLYAYVPFTGMTVNFLIAGVQRSTFIRQLDANILAVSFNTGSGAQNRAWVLDGPIPQLREGSELLVPQNGLCDQ